MKAAPLKSGCSLRTASTNSVASSVAAASATSSCTSRCMDTVGRGRGLGRVLGLVYKLISKAVAALLLAFSRHRTPSMQSATKPCRVAVRLKSSREESATLSCWCSLRLCSPSTFCTCELCQWCTVIHHVTVALDAPALAATPSTEFGPGLRRRGPGGGGWTGMTRACSAPPQTG